jgi:large repetitive protein
MKAQVFVGKGCRWRTALAMAGAITMLPITALVFAPASSASSSAYAVTELPLAPATAYAVAADSATDTVYVATLGPALAVIDAATNSVTSQISLPQTSSAVAVDSVSDTVYVLGTSSVPSPEDPDTVYVISGATNAVTNTIPLSPSFDGGVVAVNPNTDMVYVTDSENGAVIVINGETDMVATTISLADPVLDPAPTPQQVAVDTATDTIYVSDAPLSSASDDQVEVIDGTTNTVTARIALPSDITSGAMAVDPAAGLLYVPEPDAIAAIDTATDSVSTLTSGVQPGGLTLDATAGILYATTVYGGADGLGLGDTFLISTATGAVEAEIPRGGSSVALPASGGSVYVAGSSSAGDLAGDVTVITPSTVNTMSPVILNSSLNCTVGQACQAQLAASALPAATFSGAGLPAWLTVSPSGLLSGTPPAGTGGSYTVPVSAANGIAPPDTAAVPTTVDEAPAITSADQATFHVGVAGLFTMTVTGWPGSSVYESGALPSGVTFSGTGVLSGVPAAGTEGSYPIQLEAYNDVGTAAYQSFTLIVDDQPAAVALGAEGGNGELYVQAPQLAAGWQAEGGQIQGAPAVAAPPNPGGSTPAEPVFFATGSNGELWMFSLTAGWAPVGPEGALCIGSPAAVITSTGTLTVACEGLNRQLYYTTTTMPSAGLPTFDGPWTSLGGVLSAGPAVAPVGGVLTLFAEGTNGQVFTNTGSGYYATNWFCIGTLAAAFEPVSGTAIFACQGGDHTLWTADNGGAAWGQAESLGGQLIGGPAIAATSGVAPEYFAEGLDHAAWMYSSGGWMSLGGGIVGGIGAVVLD